jgi:hypothetical protein
MQRTSICRVSPLVLLALALAGPRADAILAPVQGPEGTPWTVTCPGSGGGGPVPQLFGLGPVTSQSDNSFELVSAPALSPATFVFGLGQISVPFKGGTFCPDPLLFFFTNTDVTGSLSLPFPLGNVPAGIAGHSQVWIEDGGAPQGYISSNGLRFVTQADAPPVSATLRYVARRARTPTRADHLMGVEAVLDHHALISSNLGLQLIDLDAMTVEGSLAMEDYVPAIDCFTTNTSDDGYVYVHVRQGGLAVVRLDEQALELTLLNELSEPGVFFEKMSLVGDRLYVAAHSYGIRIYSLADPALPQLVGELTEGFSDAFAIAVQGNTAYVADGDAGLKVVDITDETAPVITYSEDPMATLGAAEDVRVIGQHAYVAHGSVGVAVHELADPSQRTLYDTPVSAKHLAVAGPWLGVADIGGFEVFRIQPDGSLVHAARERGMYRQDSTSPSGLSLRLWHGVSSWGDDRFLVANWDTMDIYEVVDPQVDDQADITASTQRIRFAPAGGTTVVKLTSAGAAPLLIDSITTTEPTFTVSASSAVLQPGESLDLVITYAGGQPGGGLVWLLSNDPDEAALPIQVWGETAYIDPTEPAASFVLPVWEYDQDVKTFVHDTFDLDLIDDQVLFFQAFGTW